jgi:hypothetical protein
VKVLLGVEALDVAKGSAVQGRAKVVLGMALLCDREL